MPDESNKKYRIGDIAAITGFSRDTLRFYEKKGILHAEKAPNGYRYYTDDDIVKLMYILYLRRMNNSLFSINEYFCGTGEKNDLDQYVTSRIQEESQQIENHQKALIRLKLTQNDIKKIQTSLGSISLKPFPEGYVLDSAPNYKEALKLWFKMTAKKEELDMTYFFNCLSLDDVDSLNHTQTQLFLYEELLPVVGISPSLRELKKSRPVPSIYTIIYSDSPLPDPAHIQRMLKWAKEGGHAPGSTIYANALSITTGIRNGSYALELFIPLKEPF